MKSYNSSDIRISLSFIVFFFTNVFYSSNLWAIAGVDFPFEEDLDFSEVQEMIDAGNYDDAIAYLNSDVLEWYPENAEALTLKGYSQRGLGLNDESMRSYNAALLSNPQHQGALEYQGELFLKVGNLDDAKLNLEKLEGICPDGCEAFYKLQTAIEKFKDGTIVWSPPENK